VVSGKKKKRTKVFPPSLTKGKYVLQGPNGIRCLENHKNTEGPYIYVEVSKLHLMTIKAIVSFDSKLAAERSAEPGEAIRKLSDLVSTVFVFSGGHLSMGLTAKHDRDTFALAKNRYLSELDDEIKKHQDELGVASKAYFELKERKLLEIKEVSDYKKAFVKMLKDNQWVS